MSIRLRFLGANRQVTGSCYLVEGAGLRILVDCGMYQERDLLERNWQPRPVEAASLDGLLLTHAHLDHCGLLPRLVREGFRGTIYTTAPTVEMAELILRDSARIQEEDAAFKAERHAREGRRGPHPPEPLYRMREVEAVLPLLRGTSFRSPLELSDRATVRFLEAGHILGAASLELTLRENGATRRIVFSGDVGQPAAPIVPDPVVAEEADLVVLESTYGDRDHPPRSQIGTALAEVIADTVRRGGNLLIPTFAIERAQELLLELAALLHAGRVAPIRVFLDSPMAADATEIYRRYPDFMDAETRDLFDGPHLAELRRLLTITRSATESKAINAIRGSAIVLAGSGMCTGGRIKHHLAQHIGRPESTVLFVGFQAEGTLGRRILDGHPEVRILGETHGVRARIASIEGMSGHADRGQLVGWLRRMRRPPAQLALTHGEEQAALALAERIERELHLEASIPRYQQVLEV